MSINKPRWFDAWAALRPSGLAVQVGQPVEQLRHPLRIKLWARAAPSWQALRDGPLADARLLDDMRRRMMGI